MQFIQNSYHRLVSRFGKKRVLFSVGALATLAIVALLQLDGTDQNIVAETETKSVSVQPITALMGSADSIETVGTISAVREARLVTEAGGRITSVPVKLGDAVRAGAVIASIENSAERASLLQAQGVYEAARATAATSEVGSASADREYREALTQAENAYRGAFATADDVLRNTVDKVFSQPDSNIPGVRIDSRGRASDLSRERTELESIFDAWAAKTSSGLRTNGTTLLLEAEANVTRLASFVTTLTSLLAEEDAITDETELSSLRNAFAQARATVNGTLQTLSSARSNLIASRAAQERARIAASNGDVSLAEAQLKQALGALRLAQSNVEKTIVRSPISGTVNSLTLKEGTTVAQGMPAAIISSKGGFEVVGYVNETDARLITVGAPVTVEDAGAGIVTQLASAIDPITKKVEVRVGIPDEINIFTSGESVRLSIQTESELSDMSTAIRLPVVSIKMTPEGPVVFTVNDASQLVSHPVSLGAVIGDMIVIEDGVSPSMSIVTDARGLRAGETVSLQ
jgi:RND family efflux transporter MFP subunit